MRIRDCQSGDHNKALSQNGLARFFTVLKRTKYEAKEIGCIKRTDDRNFSNQVKAVSAIEKYISRD